MIVFAKPRQRYNSYRDFWDLARLSGFCICAIDEVRLNSHTIYITACPDPEMREWEAMAAQQPVGPRNAHLILWNLERPIGWAGGTGLYGAQCREFMYKRMFDEVWVSDRRLAQETELRYVTLGSHPELTYRGTKAHKGKDIVHMSVEVPRRQTIYKHFNNIAPNGWPPDRTIALAESKFALNVHQDAHPYQEPLRFALFAAAALPIVTETLIDAYPWGSDTMLFAPFDDIVRYTKYLLSEDYGRFAEMGERGWSLLCEKLTFSACVQQALRESVYRV